MKKKWIALSCVIVFFGSASIGLWLAKPAITASLEKTVETTINNKLNGTLQFSGMDISLSGKIILEQPVIKDVSGREVFAGKEVAVIINPVHIGAVLSGGTALSVIDSITVDTPVLYLWQNADQVWNVAALIRSGDGQDTFDFTAPVYFQNGTVEGTLSDGTVVRGEDCQGKIDFARYPEIQVDGEGKIDGKHFSVSGSYTSERKYHAAIRSDGIRAVYANAFLPDSVDGMVQNGEIDRVRVFVSQSQRGFVMSGQGDVAQGAAVIQGYDIRDVQGHVSFSADDVVLQHVTGKINEQDVAVEGIVKTNTNTPVFDISVKAPSVNLSAFSGQLQLPLTGTIGLDGKLWGTADDWEGSGKVTAANVTYDNSITIDYANADVSYADHVVSVEKLNANTAGGTIAASGMYDVNSGDYQAKGTAQQMRLERVPGVPEQVSGAVSADFQVLGNSLAQHMQADAHVTGTDIAYNGVAVDRLSGDILYADGIATIQGLTASVAGGTIAGSGTYNVAEKNPDISFTAAELPLAMLESLVSEPLSGTFDAAGHVTGTELDWDLVFSAKNGDVKGMSFDSLYGSIQGTGSHIYIPAVTWRSGEGYHLVSGEADLDTQAVNLRLQTKYIRIEQLLPLAGKEDLPVTGWADNDVVLTGTLDHLKAEGQFHFTDGSYDGYLYKNISAAYRLEDGVVYITDGDISSYDASLSVAGTAGEKLDLQITGKNIDLARIMPGNSMPRQGLIEVYAHIGGTMDTPLVSGSLRAPNITINHMALTDVRGDFGYDGTILRLTGLHFMQHEGAYDGSFMYNMSTKRMNGRADVSRCDIASILKLVNAPIQHVDGEVNGTIMLQGTEDNPALTLKGELSRAFLDGYAIEDTPLDVVFEEGVFHVNNLTLKCGNSVLAAEGTYALHGPVQMNIAAKNFPVQALLDMAGQKDIAVDSPVDFAAELGGTGDAVEANISAQLNGGTINDVSFTNAYALMNVRDGIINVNQAYAARDPYKVSASGTIPVDALAGNRTDKSMDIVVRLDNAGLDILTFLTPYVESAGGRIGGSLNISGTLAEPLVRGSVSTKDGTVKIRDTKYPLEQINGNIAFNGHDVTLNASAVMDKKSAKNPGTISLEGSASWQGWNLENYNLSADMDRLNVDNPYYQGALTGYVHVADSNGIPQISGLASLENVMLDIPLSFEDSTEIPEVGLDVTVSLGNNVRLYNPALYDITLTGSANFQGTAAHPRPSGRFEATRGTIHYLDTNFRLTKAKADFSVMDSFIPVMDVEGQTRVGQYMVQLMLRGQADNMNMGLRSNPPLTRQQIVSLITLRNSGKKQSSLTEEDLDNLMGSGIRMTLNSLGITQEIERALSLDMLTVTNGSLDLNDKKTDLSRNYYNIEMGKYLFNDFMMTAAFGLNHDDNRFGIQYDLGSKFSVNTWKSEESAFIGGLYRYTF